MFITKELTGGPYSYCLFNVIGIQQQFCQAHGWQSSFVAENLWIDDEKLKKILTIWGL